MRWARVESFCDAVSLRRLQRCHVQRLCVSVACHSDIVQPAPSRPADPNVITLAVFASPNSFDPRVGTDEVSQKVSQLVYDNLFNLDDQLRVSPGLAERFEQPDERTYVVYLRQGVKFHDGHELTSADVVHTFASLIDPSFISARKGALRSSSAWKPSTHTRCASR